MEVLKVMDPDDRVWGLADVAFLNRCGDDPIGALENRIPVIFREQPGFIVAAALLPPQEWEEV